jgi:hypothetical protein
VLLCGLALAACSRDPRDPLSVEKIEARPCDPGTSAQQWKVNDTRYLGCLTAEGQMLGDVRSYHAGETRRSLVQLERDVRNGRYVQWYASGSKLVQGQFVKGLAEGEWIWWWEDGRRRIVAHFSEGQLDGPIEAWHPNGVRSVSGAMRLGASYGDMYLWDAQGRAAQALERPLPWDVAAIFAAEADPAPRP